MKTGRKAKALVSNGGEPLDQERAAEQPKLFSKRLKQ